MTNPAPVLNISAPVTLTLSPDELGFVLDSIAERPLKAAIGPFQSIMNQVRASQAPPVLQPPEGAKDGAAAA